MAGRERGRGIRRKEGVKASTELEMVVLGVIGKFGPMTAYAVRKHFAESPTTRFSSSAGSIYPVVERLERERLVRARASSRGDQLRTLHAITPAGRRALRRWLVADLPDDAIEAPPDPIRTRLYFLESLPRDHQRGFLDRAIERLEGEVRELGRYAGQAPADQVLSRLASDGMTAVARARLRWLRRVRAALFGAG